MIALKDNNTRGDFYVENGKFKTDLTLHTIIYISLFGGNTQADTPRQARPSGVENLDWWGNVYNIGNEKPLFNSKFERTLDEVPLMSGNLNKFNSAAVSDLRWLVEKKIIKSASATSRITGADSLSVEVTVVKPEGAEEKYNYIWSATGEYLQFS